MTVQASVLIATLVAIGYEFLWKSWNIRSTQDEAAAGMVVGHPRVDNPRGSYVIVWKGGP